ncbi:MAG TPA: fibronectin type III domain-containing protein [Chitinophagaceae bacterium]
MECNYPLSANQQLQDGENSGELIYSFDRVPGAKSYIYQCTPEPLSDNSNWQSQTGTVKKVSFTDLDVSKRYWCRVVAIGINGQGVYSDPVSRIVQ